MQCSYKARQTRVAHSDSLTECLIPRGAPTYSYSDSEAGTSVRVRLLARRARLHSVISRPFLLLSLSPRNVSEPSDLHALSLFLRVPSAHDRPRTERTQYTHTSKYSQASLLPDDRDRLAKEVERHGWNRKEGREGGRRSLSLSLFLSPPALMEDCRGGEGSGEGSGDGAAAFWLRRAEL